MNGGRFGELLQKVVDSAGNPEDRQRIPANVDLSAYAGRSIDLVLATRNSLPGRPPL